jgi:hydrogenase large subunit
LLIGGVYKNEWGKIGGGISNYLAYGDFPTQGYNDPESLKMPRGIVLDRDLSKIHSLDATSPDEIKEYIYHSWYEYSKGNESGLHPFEGETNLKYTGPKPPYTQLDINDKYSWVKTPRWKDKPMEVGPLSRMLVAYATGKEPQRSLIDDTLKALDLPAEALFSTLGRTAARGLESKLNADWALEFFDQLTANIAAGDTRMVNNEKWDEDSWAKEAKGVGLTEAPRGALAHFAVIENKRIKNYQLVVPTTWNGSPRDKNGNLSAFEASLIGTPVHDPKQPLEILRTIHSFDPCLACAVHLYDEEGKYVHRLETF